ncbi:MAG TPA: EamA family transporter [Cyanobacteria bacterium UBA12227]|nr:EamA family transporter [Cyanobacteria bacterium UBA12227]HAX89599.1 EamA family transporter [Cyanobacteria bacterium UBA11370]
MTTQLKLSQEPFSKLPVTIAIISLSIGLFAISFAAIFIKLSENEISPNATIFNRLWIATIVFGLLNGINGIRQRYSCNQSAQKLPYTNHNWLLLIGFGAFFAASQLSWAWSLTQTNVGTSTLLHNLIPLFTSLGAWLLFGQHFDRKFVIGMVIAVGGVTAIGLQDLQMATDKIQGDLDAVLSALFAALYVLIVEQLRTEFTATTILFWGSAIATLVIFPWLIFTDDKLFPSSGGGWLFVIFLALICQVLGQGLIAYSLNKLSSGFVALTFLLDPVLTSLEAWAIFSERLNLSCWGTFAVVLLGIYLAISSQSAVKAIEDSTLISEP